MPALRLGLAAALLLLTSCKAREPKEKTGRFERSRETPSILGTWISDKPVRFDGEGMWIETTDGRAAYARDGRFTYAARQTIFGPQTPEAGIAFRVAVTGVWTLRDRVLTERIDKAAVTPELDFPALRRLARQMAAQARNQPPGVSDLVELTDARLQLRDRDTGQVVTYRREEASNR